MTPAQQTVVLEQISGGRFDGASGAVNGPCYLSMLDVMRSVGLVPNKDIDLIPDGKLRRFRVAGDKPGSKNGWFVLYGNPILAGAFGSWKTGECHTWQSSSDKPPSAKERAELRKQMQAAKAASASSQEAQHKEAQRLAAELLRQSVVATNDHPYLRRKKAHAHGIRQKGNVLLIPLRTADGELQSVQMIQADGSKRFLRGGRITGGFFLIGTVKDTLLIAEGFATGSTLHQATGHAVAVAFNCGNLPAVARALRSKFPAVRITVCADDDAQTTGNPGITKATEAARAVGGFVAVPNFGRVRDGF